MKYIFEILVPEISRFIGLIIRMYYDDHLTEHIHVKYAEKFSKVDFNGKVIDGELPLPKLHILKRWIELHQDELEENWEKVRKGKQPKRIEPWV